MELYLCHFIGLIFSPSFLKTGLDQGLFSKQPSQDLFTIFDEHLGDLIAVRFFIRTGMDQAIVKGQYPGAGNTQQDR